MSVYNYASFVRVLELAVPKSNMTEMARRLFEPIIVQEGVFNRVGNPYHITSTLAKNWYDQVVDIPENIKDAAGRADVVNTIGDYFSTSIIDDYLNQMLEARMYPKMISLIKESDLEQVQIDELLQLYNDNDRAEFLGRAFLYAVVRNNLLKDGSGEVEKIEKDISCFNEIIKKKKPKRLEPPEDIETHEMEYVKELYKVYHELTGVEYVRPSDLDAYPRLRRDFDRQCKDYYTAETIHRELRDTIHEEETEGFKLLKDEVYDGVITTHDKQYPKGFDRLTAVIEHASILPISHNLDNDLLNWVGPGEKKGVCHMLVNDKRLSWVEDEEDE